MSSPFLVKILNASGITAGDGPLLSVTQLDDTRTLDAGGTLSFAFPANDPRYSLISEASQFDIYDEQDGYLGRYLFRDDHLSESKGRGTARISCYDALRELTRINTGFRRQFLYSPVEDVINNLVSLAPGWTGNVQTGIGHTTVTYEGESVLAAIDVMRDRWGVHYRYSPAKTLEFGSFGANSGVLITNLEGQIQPMVNARRYVAFVDSIQRSRDADWICNVVIPVGAGQGANQLTIDGATAGDYTILTRPNGDGTSYSYIADTASIAVYGERPHVLSLPQITPLSNNDNDIGRAKNALKLTAEAYLKRHIAPNPTYSLTVRGLRQEIKVGDKTRLRYQGTDRNNVYLDINDDFYVIEISRTRTAKGDRSANLTIASIAERRTSDQDVMLDVVNDVKALKVYFQPSAYTHEYTTTDTIAASAGGAGSYIGGLSGTKPAVFKVQIDNKVTYLTSVNIRFKTFNLWTPFDVSNIPAANEAFWSVSVSPYFPKKIRLLIDNVDVSAQFGGPWNDNDVDAAVDVTCDITNLIKNAAGGMYQEHSILVVCGASQAVGDNKINSAHPAFSGDTSHGIVQMYIRVEGGTTGIKQI